MKRVYAVLCSKESDASRVCDSLQRKSSSTGFPGCWLLDPNTPEETKESALRQICETVTHFAQAPEYESVVFGWRGPSTLDELLSRVDLSECDVKTINPTDVEMLLRRHEL